MAIVVNSKFTPFSFDEMLKPALMAHQMHQDLEDQYTELATKANIWENLANQQEDAETYNMYKKYSDDLKNQADILATQGLTPFSRKALAQMKSRYSSEIIPIEQAYKTRQVQAEQQQQALLKDPTLMFSRKANTTSLDDYMRNPQLSYDTVSGADLSNRVAAQASSLATSLQDYGKGKPIDSYTNTFIKKYGFTKEQVQEAITNPTNGNPVLNAIVENTMESTGMGQLNERGELVGNGWADIDTLNRAYSYARQGLTKAVGKQDVQMFDNFAAKKNLEYENAKRIADYKAYIDSTKNPKNDIVQPRITTGVQGNINETVGRLSGLKEISNGEVSTVKKDKLQLEYNKALAELNSFIKNTDNIENIKSYKPNTSPGVWNYEEMGKALSKNVSNPPPKGYTEYMSIVNKLSKAEDALNKENEYIDSIYNKYKHLGTSKSEALNKALALIDTQEKETSYEYPLNLNETDYKKILSGIKRQLSIKEGTEVLEEVDSGKSIKVGDKKFNEIFNDIVDKGTITISSGNNPKLLLYIDGKPYSFKNYQNITNLDTYLKKSNDFLKDFSDTGINSSKTVSISDEDYANYLAEGAGSIGLNHNDLKGKITNLGDGYKGLVLHVKNSGKYIKIFLDSNNNILASNSVEEEVDYGGYMRDKNIKEASESALNKLIELFANE